MLKRFMTMLVLAAVAICGVIAANAAPPVTLINPGKWEITMHTTEPIDSPPMTSVACIPPEAITRIAPPVSKATHDCQLAGLPSLQNGVLTYTITCPKLGRTTTTKMTYSGDAYTGSVVIQNADGMTMKQTITAKRLGNCDPQD
jgi:hypothetical protein